MRQKFKSTLRLNVDLPFNGRPLKEKGPPRTPTRTYKRLKEDEESQIGLLKPDTALLSPWSPSEEYYLRTPPPRFTATPGPSTPPPAYVPNTPLRANFHHRDLGPPISPTKPDRLSPIPSLLIPETGTQGETGSTQSLIEEVQAVIEYTRDWARQSSSDPFVVANEDDEDAESDASSD